MSRPANCSNCGREFGIENPLVLFGKAGQICSICDGNARMFHFAVWEKDPDNTEKVGKD